MAYENYHGVKMLDAVATTTTSSSVDITRKGGKYLFVVTISGTVSCAIQARQYGGAWKTIATHTVTGTTSLDNYGYQEVQAVATVTPVATCSVDLSWSEV
jgi:hypothetical protein